MKRLHMASSTASIVEAGLIRRSDVTEVEALNTAKAPITVGYCVITLTPGKKEKDYNHIEAFVQWLMRPKRVSQSRSLHDDKNAGVTISGRVHTYSKITFYATSGFLSHTTSKYYV